MTEAIPTKFCTVIKTVKYYLSVIPKFAPQIQNGRQPLSWKKSTLLCQHSLTNINEILHTDAYWKPW